MNRCKIRISDKTHSTDNIKKILFFFFRCVNLTFIRRSLFSQCFSYICCITKIWLCHIYFICKKRFYSLSPEKHPKIHIKSIRANIMFVIVITCFKYDIIMITKIIFCLAIESCYHMPMLSHVCIVKLWYILFNYMFWCNYSICRHWYQQQD